MKDDKFYFNITVSNNTEKWYRMALKSLLKPCPFCGSNEAALSIHVPNKNGREDITCDVCGCKMERELGTGVALAWNQRTV